MKQLLGLGFDQGVVTFTPGGAGAGTVVISDVMRFNPSRLLAITNVTRKTLIYAAEATGKAGAWSSVNLYGGTLTLELSTTGHNAGDLLRCIYDEDSERYFDTYDETSRFMDGLHTGARSIYEGVWNATRTSAAIVNPAAATQMAWYDVVTVSVSRPCDFQLTLEGTTLYGSSAWPTTGDLFRGIVHEMIQIPIKRFVYPQMNIRGWTEFGDGAPIRITVHGFCTVLAADMNINARKSMLWIGDSISKGSGGGDYVGPHGHYAYIAKDHLCNLGYDYRLILKAEGGKTTGSAEVWRNQQALTVARPKQVGIIVYNMGANDHADPATALTNLGIFVPWARKIYPQATIIVMGPSPAENNTTEAGIATVRANYSGYVTGLADPRVLYCNLGTAFDRTDPANYSALDTAGFRIHPSAAGYAALGALVSAFLDANLGAIP
jgi:lysophospholipase L1-like esterase